MRCRKHMRNLSEVQIDYLICPLQPPTRFERYREVYAPGRFFHTAFLFSNRVARICLGGGQRALRGRFAELKSFLRMRLRELMKTILYEEAHWSIWSELLSRPIFGRHFGAIFYLSHDVNSDEVAAWVKRRGYDIGLHFSGTIYRKPIIEAFERGILNSHIGVLPKYRGRSVMEWSLFFGSPTGITVFFIDEGIDTGPEIVLIEEVPLTEIESLASAKLELFAMDVECIRALSRPCRTPRIDRLSRTRPTANGSM